MIYCSCCFLQCFHDKNLTCQAKVSTLEVNEEEDDTTLDFGAKDTDIDVVTKVLSIKHFSVHAALKGMSYEKMKALNDKIQAAKEGARMVEMLVKVIPEMVVAEDRHKLTKTVTTPRASFVIKALVLYFVTTPRASFSNWSFCFYFVMIPRVSFL